MHTEPALYDVAHLIRRHRQDLEALDRTREQADRRRRDQESRLERSFERCRRALAGSPAAGLWDRLARTASTAAHCFF